MWNDIESLQRLAKIVPYIFIIVGFVIAVGGQFAKAKVEDRVKQLQKHAEAQRQAHLLSQLEASRKEVAELGSRILAATAIVEAVLDWDALGNSNDWKAVLTGNMSYVAFGHDSEALLVIRSQSVVGASKSKPVVTFWASCDLNAPESQVNCSLKQLSKAAFIQIGLPDLFPEGTPVTGGTVHVTINGNKKLSFPIPPQKITDGKIIVTDVDKLREL
jgi:hypothetical protein